MAKEFRLEDPGEGIHEAEITELAVSEGERVAEGDVLMTIETDKAAVEVPSPFAGVIEEIRFHEGDIAEVGDVLMTYRDGGEPDRSEPRRQPAGREEEERRKGAKPDGGEAEAPEGGGRDAGREDRPVPASPATRRLARELGVELRAVEPSGPGGRVTAEDVRGHAEGGDGKPGPGRAEARRERAPEGLPDFARWGEVERRPMRSVRRATARHMARAWAEIPHVAHQDEADITDLEALRREHAEAVRAHGGKLTLTVLVMKALVAALKEHPRFNASLDPDEDEIVLKRFYNIGVAVDTERGLVVPVVREADRKSLYELSAELVGLADKSREGSLSRAEMQGGTFTITNPGPLGGRYFAPIINHPEVAILGLGRAEWRPVVRGKPGAFEIEPRLMLPVCLAFDHRVNDGADAARFAGTLVETLTDAENMLLSL